MDTLYIWLVKNEFPEWDTYSAMLVVAATDTEARQFIPEDRTKWASSSSDQWTPPYYITAERIGVALPDAKPNTLLHACVEGD